MNITADERLELLSWITDLEEKAKKYNDNELQDLADFIDCLTDKERR